VNAKELLTDLPIAEVEDITVGGGSNTDEFLEGYQRARSSAAASV
jgi:hypothetical protein